jgi:hypothetical protein
MSCRIIQGMKEERNIKKVSVLLYITELHYTYTLCVFSPLHSILLLNLFRFISLFTLHSSHAEQLLLSF